MNNKYKFLAVLALASSALVAQKIIPCATDEAMKYLFEKDPAAKARYELSQQEPLSAELQQRLSGNNQVTTIYSIDTIPVVFHILHINGPENIADNIVRQCLAEINLVHTKMIPDSAQIDSVFKGISAANNYIFQLATKDPQGACTNGIIHHYDTNTNWDQSNPVYNYSGTSAGLWNPTKYLNIYVVKQIIQPGGNGGGIVVGYTYVPGTLGTGSPYDVVVYNCNFMTGINARSMAHEFGHWLGLKHTFGNTNTPGTCLGGGASDDYLANGAAGTGVTDDTPKYAGAFSTCPPYTPNSCDVSNTANVQNIMDYSSCPKNFTAGQVKRMHNTMALATSGRNNICTAANKIFTGVRNPQICKPNVNFHATVLTACPGTIVTFSDSSENAHATSWHWNFASGILQGGTTVNDSMPKVSYAAAGTYAVSYTASTSAGGNSITKSSYITINSNVASYNTNFTEGFETVTLPGADWSINSPGLNWAVTSTAGATGSNSAMIDNFANTAGNNSRLISTSFDISGFATPKLSFKLAYQQQASSNVDKLQVFSSTDCENTWQSRWARSGTTLANITPPSGLPLTPTPSQFTTYTVNINGVSGSNNVRFKFEFFADPAAPGNNLYLDDINLYDASVGINTFESQIGLDIYPNPSSGNVTIDFTLSEKHNVTVSVTDLLGRTVESIAAKQYASGETKLSIAGKTVYEAGVYLVNLNIDGNIISKKIIIK